MTDDAQATEGSQDENGQAYPATLPLILLTEQVAFPGAILPLHVTAESEIALIKDVAAAESRLVSLVTLRETQNDHSGLDNAYEIGAIGRVLQVQQMPDGAVAVIIQALQRFRIDGLVQREPYLVVRIEALGPDRRNRKELAPLFTTIKDQANRLISLSPSIPDGAKSMLQNITDPGTFADVVAANLSISKQEKQKLLSTIEYKTRMERLIYILAREIEVMEVSNKIQEDVKSTIDQGQREFYLRHQLKAIQEELGESSDDRPEIDEYRKKIEALGLSEDTEKEVLRELDRLAHMPEASAEYHVSTTYLDWIVDLPWNTSTEDQLDIGRAEAILDEDHYGLNKVKKRILEYLAVRKLKADAAGPILCFVGPPGVGKTSLGRSIARALGRKFARISLGGVHDEAEIRGHRKTYVGALPGRIIQNIRKAESDNPIFMLDELDKLGSDFRGDPSSALLEVLDPAQNDTFTDHYLNVPFDLSKVMFVATANMLDTIPWALRDRMEIIEIPGYTTEEKLQIARRYLVDRQLEANGIPPGKLSFTTAAIRKIIGSYTREAGVRNLEREIANICRGCARAFAGTRRKAIGIKVDDVQEYLGNPRFFHDTATRTRIPGVAIGLSWTPVGGEILYIESTKMPGKGKLILTGQLGDIMQESAQAALSYIRSNAATLGIPDETFSDFDIHIHVPQGAVPKDGPSAGVTMLTAITSLLTGKHVKNGLAMTGEITLRGLVLPVGGVKEKVLAAVRAGIKELILPERCEGDLDDIPESARKGKKFHFVKEMKEVLNIALGVHL